MMVSPGPRRNSKLRRSQSTGCRKVRRHPAEIEDPLWWLGNKVSSTMNILVLCSYGRNRSAYLASFLKRRGYRHVEYGGVDIESHIAIVRKLAAADVVITVHGKIANALRKGFDLAGKRIVELDVDDSTTNLSGVRWTEFQKRHVYPKLEEQIERYLPLEASS
jgi:predicted protein tyrosine phosphatase